MTFFKYTKIDIQNASTIGEKVRMMDVNIGIIDEYLDTMGEYLKHYIKYKQKLTVKRNQLLGL